MAPTGAGQGPEAGLVAVKPSSLPARWSTAVASLRTTRCRPGSSPPASGSSTAPRATSSSYCARQRPSGAGPRSPWRRLRPALRRHRRRIAHRPRRRAAASTSTATPRAYHPRNREGGAVLHLCVGARVWLPDGSSYEGSAPASNCAGRFMTTWRRSPPPAGPIPAPAWCSGTAWWRKGRPGSRDARSGASSPCCRRMATASMSRRRRWSLARAIGAPRWRQAPMSDGLG